MDEEGLVRYVQQLNKNFSDHMDSLEETINGTLRILYIINARLELQHMALG